MFIVFIHLNKVIHITVMINVYFYLTCIRNDRSQIDFSNKIYTHRELDCGENFVLHPHLQNIALLASKLNLVKWTNVQLNSRCMRTENTTLTHSRQQSHNEQHTVEEIGYRREKVCPCPCLLYRSFLRKLCISYHVFY